MSTMHKVRGRTKSIVVGVVDDRCSGSLAYALTVALEESATIRAVRVSNDCLADRAALGLPLLTVETTGDPLEALIRESREVDLLVVEAPHDPVAALIDPLLVQLRRRTETVLIEVDHRGEIVRASGPEGWSYSTTDDRVPSEHPTGGVICVGVDSSPAGNAALAWAAGMALQTSARLRLVSVYGSEGSTARRTEQDARADIASAVALLPGTVTESSVMSGEPADRLLDAARGARMLVLGRHSTQGILHNASASVGDTCARMADCPVVIVPLR